MPPGPPRVRKVAVVGSRAVGKCERVGINLTLLWNQLDITLLTLTGKSSMTLQYVEEHFVESYYPTIENQFSKTIRYRGQEFSIEILDTAGQDEFSIINQKHLIGIHGYLLVYSVASKSTFEMIRVVLDKILNNTGTDRVPAVIVGNKSDLHIQRQVSEEEGRELAKALGCGFVETSARHNENINRAFELLLAEIERQQNPVQEETGKCIIQ